MAKAGMKALVRVSGAPLSLTNEACAEVAGSGLKKYRVTDAAKRVLDRTEYIGVQQNTDGVNWVGVSAADYTLNRLTGTITFHVARATGTLVRISTGKYLPMATAAECRDFSLSLSGNNVSVASFGTEWEKRLATTKDVSGSLSRWASTDKYFRDNRAEKKWLSSSGMIRRWPIPTFGSGRCWHLMKCQRRLMVHRKRPWSSRERPTLTATL